MDNSNKHIGHTSMGSTVMLSLLILFAGVIAITLYISNMNDDNSSLETAVVTPDTIATKTVPVTTAVTAPTSAAQAVTTAASVDSDVKSLDDSMAKLESFDPDSLSDKSVNLDTTTASK